MARPKIRDEHLRATRQAIEAGRRMVNGHAGDPSLGDIIWRLLQDAAETLSRLPDRERVWLLSAERAAWPEIWRDAQERFEVELEQRIEGKFEGRATRVRSVITDPTAETRMLTVLNWLRHYEAGSRHRTKRDKLVVLSLAHGQQSYQWIKINIMRTNCGDSALRMIKQRVLNRLVDRLGELLTMPQQKKDLTGNRQMCVKSS